MIKRNNPASIMVVYGSAVAVFFVLTAVLVTGFQSVLSNSLERSRSVDDIFSSSRTSLPVSSQFEPLAVKNQLISYAETDIANTYLVNFGYEINNTYDFDIDLNNAAVSLLQGENIAQVVQVVSLESDQIILNNNFDALGVRELLSGTQTIKAGQKAMIDMQLELVFGDDAPPIRNVFDVIGTKSGSGAQIPVSMPVSFTAAAQTSTSSKLVTDVEPASYGSSSSKATLKNIFNGSAVSVFFPGISLN